MLIFSTNKEYLLKHFRKDPVLFAYHMADLDDRFFPNCQWAVSHKSYTQIEEVALIYHGGQTPTVLAFGLTSAFAPLLEELLDLLPSRFFCHYLEEHRGILERGFRFEPLGTHHKMKLESLTLSNRKLAAGEEIVTLAPSHDARLASFYIEAYPGNYYDPAMLSTGRYTAIMQDSQILAAAGVHAISEKQKIAALGNIATHPKHRGKGYSQIVTSALAAALVKEKMIVALNVLASNQAAIRVYEKLGFVRTHSYEEAILTRR